MDKTNLKSVKITEAHHAYLWLKSGPQGSIIETLENIIEEDRQRPENKKFLPIESYSMTEIAGKGI